MPSTSRATSAFAANALLLLAMASFGSTQYTKVYKGCYSSSQPLKSQGTWTYQSSDYCQQQCEDANLPVLGLSDGNLCWCGSQLPAASDKVSDSQCDTPCQGWPDESCGGSNKYFSIWLTGEETSVPSYGGGGDSSSSSPSSTTSSTTTSSTSTSSPTPSVVTTSVSPGKTVVVTRPAEATTSANTDSNSGGSTNVAGIAAGVVVGVVAAASIVGGIFFYLRHRRRKAAEDEYARTNQVSDFMKGGGRKPPPTSYSSASDSRLDPEANKRNSVGSLADNQDYSRRILRVANPDRS